MSRVFVHGFGAVSPAGWGVVPLRDSMAAGHPLPVQTLARPGWETPMPKEGVALGSAVVSTAVFGVPPKTIAATEVSIVDNRTNSSGVAGETPATLLGRKIALQLDVRPVPPPTSRLDFLSHPRLRRASPMAHYAVAAALEALGPEVEIIRSGALRLGIITCTLTGGISYSRRFYQEVLQNPATASPMIFPETVFNAPASHLAAYLGSSAISYALVGDAGTYMQGLAVAAEWLENDTVGACLVIGAEEPDWTAADALRLFNRRAHHASGAGAIYLKCDPPTRPGVELAGITDSFAATHQPGSEEAARKMRAQLPEGTPDDLLCASEPHHPVWRDWPGKVFAPKEILGEGFAVGAAWQCVLACAAIQQGQCAGAHAIVAGAGVQAIGARFVNTTK